MVPDVADAAVPAVVVAAGVLVAGHWRSWGRGVRHGVQRGVQGGMRIVTNW